MMNALTVSAAMTFGLLAAGAAHAQQDATAEPQAASAEAPAKMWTFAVSIGQVGLDEEYAADNIIGDSIYELSGEAHYWFTPNIAATGAFTLARMDDDNRSSELVCPITDPNCDPEEVESAEAGVGFSGGLEARVPMGERFVALVDGGHKFVNFSREIPNCTNCVSGEDISVNGAFAGVGLGIRTKTGLVTLRYRQGFGEELAGGMIHLGYQF